LARRQCERMKRAFLYVVIVFSALRLPAQTNETVRLALISESAGASAALAILTVDLSNQKNLQLLERSEIDKVYHEQSLSAGKKDYLKLGQILGADGVVIVETPVLNNNPVLAIRIVAVRPGVVVGDFYCKNPPEDLQKWAAEQTEKINSLIPKLSVPSGQAIPVSVLNLRSTILRDTSRDLERDLTLLLTLRLANEPRLFVLERVQMEKLAFEKQIASGSPSAFWASSYLIDGEISESSNNAVSIKLRLEHPGQNPQTIQVDGNTKALLELTESLAKALLHQMGQQSQVEAWKQLEEGRRFYEEAKSAFQAGLLDEALAAAEASRALGLDSDELRKTLLQIYAIKTIKVNEQFSVKTIPVEDVDLKSALKAIDIYSGLVERNIPICWEIRRKSIYEPGPSLLLNASRAIRWYRENGLYASQQDDLDLLREKLRDVAHLLLANDGIKASCEFYCVMACYAPYWYDEPDQVFNAYDEVLAQRFNNYAYNKWWVRHHLTQYRDKPFLFGTYDLDLRVPWLIDWKGIGSEGLKNRWSRFVQRRTQSLVLNDRLDGLLLAYYGIDSQKSWPSVIDCAMAEIWTNRAAVVGDPMTFAIATSLIRSLPLGEDFRFRFLDYYLKEGQFFDEHFFSACFESGFTNRTHAAILTESMKGFEQRLALTVQNMSGQYSDFHGFQEQLLRAFPDLRGSPSEELKVTLSWPPLTETHLNDSDTYWPRQIQYAAGAVWVSGDESFSNRFQTTFTRVELPDFQTSVIKAPFSVPKPDGGSMSDFDHAFVVTDGWLFWVSDGRLARCNLTTGKWEAEIEVPNAKFPLLKFVNDQLYYTFPTEPREWAYEPQTSGILRIDPRTLKVDVLASSRRKPAINKLDDVPAYFVYDLFSGPENRLYVSVLSGPVSHSFGQIYVYSETNGEWQLTHPEVSRCLHPYRVVPFNGGNLIQPIGWALEGAFNLYSDGHFEWLFSRPDQQREHLSSRWTSPSQIWDHTPWSPVMATSDGNDTWILGPRRGSATAPLNLYFFTRGTSEPKTIPLCFPSANTENYPVDSGSTQLLGTPEGLIIAGTRDTGFWFLPKQKLQAFIAQSVHPTRGTLAVPTETLAADRSSRTNMISSRIQKSLTP